MSICNSIVSTKIFDKQDDFDIENFPFLSRISLSIPLKVSTCILWSNYANQHNLFHAKGITPKSRVKIVIWKAEVCEQ